MLPKAYDPQATEDRIYKMWEESGAFTADANSDKEAFTISMPPPNATGQLHLGHAVMLALEDIFIRFNRMRGKEALWVPGTDHAAIATESVVIRKVQKEEKIPDPRAKLGRDELVRRIMHFVEESQGTIRNQVRKMGTSCDWSREKYTMDPPLARCTNEVFKDMVESGVLYRGERVVNWDTALQTTISDDEIEYKDSEAVLYTFEYLSAKQTGGKSVCIATSRPETKLGDTALAVHPDDKRYKKLVGKDFRVQWPGGKTIRVSVIADHSVDASFGSGVVGVTPFHSKIDFEMWQRHKDAIVSAPEQVIGEDGNMTDAAGSYAGMTTAECREAFVEGLRQQGRMQSEEKYMQPLSISYRSKKAIEPLPKLQWFIDVNKKVLDWKGKKRSIKEVMQDVVQSGDITIIPERFEKTYFQWIDNLQDWCVSRQIWWGHRVPVWYKGKEMHVGAVAPAGSGWEQDSDTLDTWYGVAMWTWATLVDPKLTEDFSLSLKEIIERSPDLLKFHPTDVMETGYDILFFWVARMILMTTYTFSRFGIGTDESQRIPFKTVYLHGLVRARDGQKMSKSHPETMIDPLDIIPKYGADALRMSMIIGQSPGNDQKLYEEKIAGYRNFVNKLWNASRFVLMQCDAAGIKPAEVESGKWKVKNLSLADRAVLSSLQDLIFDVTTGLEQYRLSDVGERLYGFTWDYFCDWYLELSKGGDPTSPDGLRGAGANPAVLIHVLRTLLILLHPYCPFVTEELWDSVKSQKQGMLIKQSWPEVDPALRNSDSRDHLQKIIDVITAIRSIRAEQGIEPSMEIAVVLHTIKWVPLLESQEGHIRRLGRVGSLTIETKPQQYRQAASVFLPEIEVHVPLEGLIDIEKEIEKLGKEKVNLERFIKSVEGKLGNKEFVSNAPKEVVDLEKEKLETNREKLKKVKERLDSLS